ncbi:MAG: hypothetical protein ABIH79_02440 [archaeon]
MDNLLQRLPSVHSCNTVLEERKIQVDGRILNLNPYPVDYCPKCNIYKYNDIESMNPRFVGRYITRLQEETNQLTNKSMFNIKFRSSPNKKP